MVLVSWLTLPMWMWGYSRLGWGLCLVHLRVWAGVRISMGIPLSADMGYVRGSLQGREREWRMVAGWDIIGGAIGHSLKVVAAHGCLSKEVPMAPWPFVVVGTCGHSLMVVMGPSCRSSIVVVGGHGRSLILVMGTCRWW